MVAALAGGAMLWVALLPLAAWAVQGDAALSWRGLGLIVYRFAAVVCHQLPERSFALGVVPLPVCARCTGLYLGAASMALVAAGRLRPTLGAPVWRPKAVFDWVVRALPIRVLALAALPTAITLVSEWIAGADPGNWVRAAAGGPLGAALALVLVNEVLVETGVRRQPDGHPR